MSNEKHNHIIRHKQLEIIENDLILQSRNKKNRDRKYEAFVTFHTLSLNI